MGGFTCDPKARNRVPNDVAVIRVRGRHVQHPAIRECDLPLIARLAAATWIKTSLIEREFVPLRLNYASLGFEAMIVVPIQTACRRDYSDHGGTTPLIRA